MRYCLLALTCGLLGLVRANETQLQGFKGQKKSAIQWGQLEPLRWLDFQQWKRDLTYREQFPNWYYNLLDAENKELMGRVLACVGECRVYRGEGLTRGHYYSSVKEGDEIETMEDSYLWLFLLDGTLVRLSPKTSVAFNEINIGQERNFIRIRVNYGQMQWLSRSQGLLKSDPRHETDPLFYPLKVNEANPHIQEHSAKKSLYEQLNEKNQTLEQIKRLNEWVKRNNQWVGEKRTYAYIVLPNVTIKGENLRLNTFVISGGSSYFKQYSFESYLTSSGESSEQEFYMRGFRNSQKYELQADRWHQVDASGRNYQYLGQVDPALALSEIFVKRIPSLYLAREIMMLNLSKHFYSSDLDKQSMAKLHGYRLWEKGETKKGSEISKRMSYLDEYVRRTETTLVREAIKLRRIQRERKQIDLEETFDNQYYRKAMEAYLNSMPAVMRKKNFNSLRQKIWRIKNVNGKF